MTYSNRLMMMDFAARAVSEIPGAKYDEGIQKAILREYGLFLDEMPQSEVQEFRNMLRKED
ncbi:MAG: hypothetical protein NC548_22790 [Lachnospiraceae bacterium]|nr:hypothetical protein [Lachnospiraceae bacterium]